MIGFNFLGAAAWFALACSAALPQTVREIAPAAPPAPRQNAPAPPPAPGRTVPAVLPAPKQITPREVATPFPPEGCTPVTRATVELRPANEMAAQDRKLESGAEASIAEQAGLSGMEFTSGRWSYRQIVCPAFPNHLLLRFTRDESGNGGTGDVSVFSASIPRSGSRQGLVRVIPILRRSYSLFSPAPVNALTIAAFNHIRAEEPSDQGSDGAGDWTAAGLCYAALAGANPRLARPEEWASEQTTRPGSYRGLYRDSYPAFSAELRYPAAGGAILHLTDMNAGPRAHAAEWILAFKADGKLVKVSLRPASLTMAKEIHPKPAPAPAVSQPGPAQ